MNTAMCALVASSNVAIKTNYSEWACTVGGSTVTSPCLWTGVYCNFAGEIEQINIQNKGITGKRCASCCSQKMFVSY